VDTEVTRDGAGAVIRSRPAIARFALAEPVIREPGSSPARTTGKVRADAASTLF